jgi:hypothetical protein
VDNPRCKQYPNNGGIGIKFYTRWYDFAEFVKWSTANGYSEDLVELSLLRIDKFKDYCPQNCTWVPFKDQSRYRTNTTYIDIQGESKTISDWSRETGVPAYLISKRNFRGKKGEELLDMSDDKIYVLYKGERKTLWQISKEVGINYTTLLSRYKRYGENLEKLLSKDILYLRKNYVEIDGVAMGLKEASIKYNIGIGALKWRYKKGLRGIDLIKGRK